MARKAPVYFTVRKVQDVETGQQCGALVPLDWASNLALRERQLRAGDTVRATLTKPRNVQFHRMVHQLGSLAVENLDAFEGLDSHGAVKKLQRDSGAFCEPQEIDAKPIIEALAKAAGDDLGPVVLVALNVIQKISIQQPRSIAFDSMDELEFRQLWSELCGHLIKTYWPTLSPEQIEAMAELMPLT